jgi:maleylpyruvate isomerase
MTALAWMHQCTDLFLAALTRLSDDELGRPTALPGWSRRHLLAHVGFNARALQRLTVWARTGEPHPMYGSPEQRATEIATGATWDGPRLRAFVSDSAAELAADLDGLDDGQWRAVVVTAQGRTVPATEIPWLRTREVAVHAVDLGGPVTFDDLPTDLCLALVADVVARRSSLRRDPPVTLRASTGQTWTIDTGPDPVSVAGSPAQLARWLTGRGPGGLRPEHPDLPLPVLTPWL